MNLVRIFLAGLMATAYSASAVAQQLPSPTFNNVTINGNLNLPSKAANNFFVAPNGSAGAPTFRTMLAPDMPLDQRQPGAVLLGTSDANGLSLSTNGTARFSINSSGSFLPGADDAYAFGSASFRLNNFFSDEAKLGTTGWLEPIVPTTESIAKTVSLSPEGIYGLIGASKSDANAVPGAMSAIGVGAFSINNNTVDVQSGFAAYLEARRYSGAGSTTGLETAMINRGSSVTISPYTPVVTGQNSSVWASCGRPDVVDSANCSVAYGIFNAGPSQASPFNTGILFAANSLAGTDTTAIDMPARYNVIWRDPTDGDVASGVRSNTDNGTTTGALSFENAGVELQAPIGTMVARFASTAVTISQSLFTNAINSTSISATGSVSATTTISANVGFTGPAISGVAVGPGAGTGGSVGAVCAGGHECTQSSGQVQVTTGSSGTAAGRIATVTFANARSLAPNCVVTGYNNAVTINISAMPATSATTLEIHVPSALTTGTVYQINYVCGGA